MCQTCWNECTSFAGCQNGRNLNVSAVTLRKHVVYSVLITRVSKLSYFGYQNKQNKHESNEVRIVKSSGSLPKNNFG